jgi:glycosyltransferase involved in cell wall biosynthesis
MAKKKRILFVVPYPYDKAPSQRLKFEQYYDQFRAAGYEVEWSSFYDDAAWQVIYKRGNIGGKIAAIMRGYVRRVRDLFRLGKYEVVYTHLWVTPIGPPFFEWLYCAIARRKMIYDIDDLIFLKDATHIAWWKRMIKGRKKPILLMKGAKHVITCTPFLDEFVRRYNPNTTDISSTINTDTYKAVNGYANDHKIVLGWSGSHSTAAYLHLLSDVLRELHQEQAFKLLVMGDKDFKMDGVEVEALPWSADKEIPTLQRIDIGLYPLPDEEWVLGKSGLKALQYMSLGIPTIATAIGANYRVIEDGVSGYLVKTPEEWKAKLRYLMQQPEERRRLGTAAQRRVEELYSIRSNAPVYLSILDGVVFETEGSKGNRD